MITLAQHYGGESIDVRDVAQAHDLPLDAFKGIVKQLENSELIQTQ